MPNLSDRDGAPLIRAVMPELDSLRGIAILLVLVFHAFDYGVIQISGMARLFVTATHSLGWLGVNLFFVLSGFLITGILLDSRDRPDYFKRFYIRRALRILPLYYLVLLALYPLAHTGWLGSRQISWRFVALSAVYLSNVVDFFGVPLQFAVLWSLAVEEQFYIVWPAIVRVLSRRGVLIATLSIIVGCPLLRAFAYEHGYQYASGYIWLVADELAFGALLGVLSRGWLSERKRMLYFSIASVGAGAALLGFGAPFGIMLNRTLLGASLRLTALNLIFTGVVAGSLVMGTGRFRRVVQQPALQFFGRISYGLYLLHMLAFDFLDHLLVRYFPATVSTITGDFRLMVLRFVLGVGLATTIAVISRQYFEEYFLRMKARWSTPSTSRDKEVSEPRVLSLSAADAAAATQNSQ
jgi:peptidoglycan/LPS O-acetylase OafA/YrhL